MKFYEKSIDLNEQKINYTLEYKNVKNINLRIKQNGEIFVSANRFVSPDKIEEFLILKKDFILNALKRFENKRENPLKQYRTIEALYALIFDISKDIYPYFEKQGVAFPNIKLRKMTSCWGSCHYKDNTLVFNKYLVLAPKECVEYVVYHEFTHFSVPNHSKKFYDELAKICPEHRKLKSRLNEILIPKQ